MSDAGLLRELADREEIRDVILRYCRGCDGGDVELVKSAYHPDATDEHGALFTATMHFVGNILIELDGDSAAVETYVVAHHRLEHAGRAWDITGGGRYVDRFERRDGTWKIAYRRTAGFWRRTDEVGPEAPRDALAEPQPWRNAAD